MRVVLATLVALAGCCPVARPRGVGSPIAQAPSARSEPLLISHYDDMVTHLHLRERVETVGQSRYTASGTLGISAIMVDSIVAAQVRKVLTRDRSNFDISFTMDGDAEAPAVKRPWSFVASGVPDELPSEYQDGGRRSLAILETWGVRPGTRIAVGTRRYVGRAGADAIATEYRVSESDAGPLCIVWIDGEPSEPERLSE